MFGGGGECPFGKRENKDAHQAAIVAGRLAVCRVRRALPGGEDLSFILSLRAAFRAGIAARVETKEEGTGRQAGRQAVVLLGRWEIPSWSALT